jgi:hypothetical protein
LRDHKAQCKNHYGSGEYEKAKILTCSHNGFSWKISTIKRLRKGKTPN